MSVRNLVHGLVIGTSLFLCLPSARADHDVIKQIPDHALAYVVVTDMQQVSRQIDRIAERMQLPAPQLLQMLKNRLGVPQGVVNKGDMAIALVGRDGAFPFPVIFVRTDDYAALLTQLRAEPSGTPISQAKVGSTDTLIAQKGQYALFAPPPFRDEFERVISTRESVAVDDSLQSFTQDAKVFALATNHGVKMICQQARQGLQAIKGQLAEIGPQGQSVLAGLALYDRMFQWAEQEVGEVAVALDMGDANSISLAKRVTLLTPQQLAAPSSAADVLARLSTLPKRPYLMAMAGQITGFPGIETWMDLSADMLRAMAGPELTDEQIKDLMQASRKSLQGLRSMAFSLGVPEAGETIYRRMAMVMEVEDAESYMDDYLNSTKKMLEMFPGNERIPFRLVTAQRVQVAGVQGMRVVMQVLPAAMGVDDERLQTIFEKLYGRDGKIEFFAAPVNAHHIALAYESKAGLEEVMQAVKSAEDGLATDEGVRSAAGLLPEKAQMVGLLSPEGLLLYTQRMIEMIVPEDQRAQMPLIPSFPSSPPLACTLHHDGNALEVRLVAPMETVVALGEFIQKIRQ